MGTVHGMWLLVVSPLWMGLVQAQGLASRNGESINGKAPLDDLIIREQFEDISKFGRSPELGELRDEMAEIEAALLRQPEDPPKETKLQLLPEEMISAKELKEKLFFDFDEAPESQTEEKSEMPPPPPLDMDEVAATTSDPDSHEDAFKEENTEFKEGFQEQKEEKPEETDDTQHGIPANSFSRNAPDSFEQNTFVVGKHFVPHTLFTNQVKMDARSPMIDMLIPQLPSPSDVKGKESIRPVIFAVDEAPTTDDPSHDVLPPKAIAPTESPSAEAPVSSEEEKSSEDMMSKVMAGFAFSRDDVVSAPPPPSPPPDSNSNIFNVPSQNFQEPSTTITGIRAPRIANKSPKETPADPDPFAPVFGVGMFPSLFELTSSRKTTVGTTPIPSTTEAPTTQRVDTDEDGEQEKKPIALAFAENHSGNEEAASRNSADVSHATIESTTSSTTTETVLTTTTPSTFPIPLMSLFTLTPPVAAQDDEEPPTSTLFPTLPTHPTMPTLLPTHPTLPPHTFPTLPTHSLPTLPTHPTLPPHTFPTLPPHTLPTLPQHPHTLPTLPPHPMLTFPTTEPPSSLAPIPPVFNPIFPGLPIQPLPTTRKPDILHSADTAASRVEDRDLMSRRPSPVRSISIHRQLPVEIQASLASAIMAHESFNGVPQAPQLRNGIPKSLQGLINDLQVENSKEVEAAAMAFGGGPAREAVRNFFHNNVVEVDEEAEGPKNRAFGRTNTAKRGGGPTRVITTSHIVSSNDGEGSTRLGAPRAHRPVAPSSPPRMVPLSKANPEWTDMPDNTNSPAKATAIHSQPVKREQKTQQQRDVQSALKRVAEDIFQRMTKKKEMPVPHPTPLISKRIQAPLLSKADNFNKYKTRKHRIRRGRRVIGISKMRVRVRGDSKRDTRTRNERGPTLEDPIIELDAKQMADAGLSPDGELPVLVVADQGDWKVHYGEVSRTTNGKYSKDANPVIDRDFHRGTIDRDVGKRRQRQL